MGSFSVFFFFLPAERTSLFHPRLTGFLFSSPPSNVRALKSAANQSFMVFWGQFDIHALLFSLQQLQGDCPGEKKNGQVALSLSLFLSLRLSVDEYGNVTGKEDMATKYNSGSFSVFCFFYFFSRAAQDSEKARWVTGHEKRLLWNSCFLWAGPSYVCLLFPDEISARFQWGILSHLDWFTFIAFIAQIRGKWRGQGGGALLLY